MKLCVFPNDPIIEYYKKGEIKERYFNPNNLFDEVHIISFSNDEVDEKKVQKIAGNAKIKIYSVGKISLKNHSKYLEKIITLVKKINPDVIRSFNPLLQGWFAAKCAQELNIPFFLSLHTQYDQNRSIAKKNNLKKFLGLKYTEKFLEPYVLKHADKITIVYRIIEPYVLKHGGKKPELLYNKVNCNQFTNASIIKSLDKPLIISVGQLIDAKNHMCIINAMKNINAKLLIIGDGILFEKLNNYINNNELQNKIKIKKSIPHDEIQNYYHSADIFTLAYDPKLEGIPIPVIEAMASGLPIVIPFPIEGYSDNLENTVIFSERNSESFSKNLEMVLKDSKMSKELSEKSLIKSKNFDSKIIEDREKEIYQEILS
ncbi:MAG: glycosyltransferase family 1 protein [Thaumarchaeota archaeon]|jgi:glycosyltransferase involved in cell wall biosynthesis|nr:MAG: glycosyltransferase family 1 protein [Nitrososphaerota archaeon]